MKAEATVTVDSPNGLHARPAMALVDAANGFESDITLTKPPGDDEGGGAEPTVVDAKSVMQVITLAAVQGTSLTIVAEGDDADAAVAALVELFERQFDE